MRFLSRTVAEHRLATVLRLFAKCQRWEFARVYPNPSPTDHTTIVTYYGTTAVLTAIAAVSALRIRRPQKLIAAVSVAPRYCIDLIADHIHKCVVLDVPDSFKCTVCMH